MTQITLKPREERRLRAGHVWVYSNEIQTDEHFRKLTPGQLCRVHDARNKPLGLGYVNPHCLLAVRMLSGNVHAEINVSWLVRRIEAALSLRARLFAEPSYRLIYAESDGLPGVVVDRYGDYLVVQLTTAGAEQLKPLLIEALQTVLAPRGIVLRNDSPARELEGLPAYVEEIGEVPASVQIAEGGTRYEVALKGGQKTGFFFDQRDNRARLARYVPGRRVLDVFSYVGAWALHAHTLGASDVACIDSSEPALAAARRNAELNGADLQTYRGEALDEMKRLRAEAQIFDVVVVDPPALIKRKKDFEAGLEHYAALNRAAMQLLSTDGILIACSCSQHLEPEQLQRILLRESRSLGKRLQILEQGGQGPDHPVHPAIAETRYLKAFYVRVVQG